MKKRFQLVLAVASAGLVLTGCGGSAGSAAKAEGTNAATALTKDSLVSSVTAAQQKARSSHVVMNIDAAGHTIVATGDIMVGLTAADTRAAMTMDISSLGAGKFEMRLIDKVFFINLGSMSGNKFAKIDLTDKSNPLAAQYGSLVDQLDPSKQLDQFKAALTGLDKKGAAITIDGVKAQPYVLTLDTKKLTALMRLGAAAAAQLPASISYTMYIGPDNLPRRLITDVAGSKISMDYSKWGEAVDIKAPAKGEITSSNVFSHLGKAPA